MSVSIFISGVSDEFGAYREGLRRDLTRHNVEVKIQEDFKDAGSVTLDKLDLYISHCDAVIHLVGDMTGSYAKLASTAAILAKYSNLLVKLSPLREPLSKGEGISYTQWEAWLAHYHGKTLLIAQADPAAPRGPKYAPTPEQVASQQIHLQRLSEVERYPGFTFANPENLAKQIAYGAILDILTKERTTEVVRETLVRVARNLLLAIVGIPALLFLTSVAVDWLIRAHGLTLGVTGWLLGGMGGAALALVYWRYLDIVGSGAAPNGSLERRAYDSLRASVAAGGLPVMLYSRWLTRFLNAIDRFFGDAGLADRTLFPHAFGLRTPAPLWTAQAFDRCLLLALLYPIATIFIIWAVSGHVGPAEAALKLKQDFFSWGRGLAVALLASQGVAFWLGLRTTGWRSWAWNAVAVVSVAVVAGFGIGAFDDRGFNAAAFAFAGAFAFAFAIRYVNSGAIAVGGAIAFNVFGGIFFDVTGAHTQATFVASAFALVLAIAGTGICYFAATWLRSHLNGPRWYGIFLSGFVAVFILACLLSAYGLSRLSTWQGAGVLILFLGLLTLINAPFDWLSLGLTRALLRRGLELGGWWPYLLALTDALLAGVIIAALALAMVIGVQAFDTLAVRGGGYPILPLTTLFDGIAAQPEAPKNWWIYALLLSTMIPSLVNLVIGGAALMRALPWLPSLLMRFMPAGRAVPTFDRAWLACVLTLQVVGGVILGVTAQALLAVGLISYVMPWFGLGLLDLAHAVAAFNLPAKIGQLFGVML